MLLLDTNVISELRRDSYANEAVRRWASSQNIADSRISAITILEIEIGVLRLARKNPKGAIPLRNWVEQTLRDFDQRILPMDATVALRCAALHVPNLRPERDAWIAATALVHDLTIVTRNVRDFVGTGVRLINPWVD